MSRFNRLEFQRPQAAEKLSAPIHSQAQAQAEQRDQHYWMAQALEERRCGLFENALRYYSRALEVDRSLVLAWVGQVQMLVLLGEYPEAELWARKALELFKQNAELLAARAQALCRTGDLKSAQASCDAAIGQQGLFSYPWLVRGELMLARRENLDAYCFDRAVQLDGDWLVSLEIGGIYLHYGKPAKALARLKEAVEKAPDSAYCWYRQGACELSLGLTRPAERSLRRCLELKPKHADARRALTQLEFDRKPVRRFLRRMLWRR